MAKVVTLRKKDQDTFLSNFVSHLAGKDIKPAAYAGDVRRFADWVAQKYGDFFPGAISTLDVVEYRAYLQAAGKAPATINRALVSLRVFFGWLVESGQAWQNPVSDVKRVVMATCPAPKWLTRAQQAALFHVIQTSLRDMAIFGLMLHAGLRVSEVCRLNRDDLQISERKGIVRIRQGKGNKFREVPLSKTIRKILSDWLERNPEGPLFPNRWGQPITISGVEKLLAEYAYRAKLQGITPHTLRHCFCKNLLDMGVPLDQVAMLAGHASLDVTKQYTAPSMADLQNAVDRTAWE